MKTAAPMMLAAMTTTTAAATTAVTSTTKVVGVADLKLRNNVFSYIPKFDWVIQIRLLYGRALLVYFVAHWLLTI